MVLQLSAIAPRNIVIPLFYMANPAIMRPSRPAPAIWFFMFVAALSEDEAPVAEAEEDPLADAPVSAAPEEEADGPPVN
jgi:hypothetical protein